MIDVLRLQILLVCQLHLLGQRNAARRILRQVLHQMERTSYVRMLLNEPTLAPIVRSIQTDFSRTLAPRMEPRPMARPQTVLSEQQTMILHLRADDLSMEEVAGHLIISLGTLKWHLTRIYAKLGVENRNQAVATAHARYFLQAHPHPIAPATCPTDHRATVPERDRVRALRRALGSRHCGRLPSDGGSRWSCHRFPDPARSLKQAGPGWCNPAARSPSNAPPGRPHREV